VEAQSAIFVSFFIIHTAYTVDACAFTSILPPVTLTDMIYCTERIKATPASIFRHMDFASSQRCETFITELRDFIVFSVLQTVMEIKRIG